jgi:CheY-like chemotaxis protein
MNHALNSVLLIDDDEPTNYINKMLIEDSGFVRQVEVVQSGQAALNYLIHSSKMNSQHQLPELIFLDINMPAMNGWEFLSKYSELKVEDKKKTIIIMLTTTLNPDDELKAYSQPEIAAFESKPLTKDKLIRIFNKYFKIQV